MPSRCPTRRATFSLVVLSGALAAGGLVYGEKAKPIGAKSSDGFIHPDKVDSALSDLMDDIGVKARSITFRAPAGYDAIIRIVARDKTGNVLPTIARRHIFHDEPGESNECTVRLAKIDPSALNEEHQGKVRWRVLYRHLAAPGAPVTVSSDAWSRNWFAEKGASTSWAVGDPVESPEPEKEFKVWETVVHEKITSAKINPADREMFRGEMWIKFVKAKVRDRDTPRLETLSADDDTE